MSDVTTLKSLGESNTQYQFDEPNINILETFTNLHPKIDYIVEFNCPEFTSLCPKTHQPDFANIYIEYIPSIKMVESKSLKLYLFSFRNFGEFHEDCVCRIANDLNKLMAPKFIRVVGYFYPRGGISIYPQVALGDINLYRNLKIKEEQ